MNARVRVASVLLALFVAAAAWRAFSTRDEALGARRALSARLSLAAGRTASLAALRQQLASESGRGRSAAELIGAAEVAAATEGERQGLRALRTCLERSGADTGTANTGTSNTGTANTGTANTGTANTGTANADTPNTGTTNTGTPNTGTPNTGTTNTGTTNTGTTNNCTEPALIDGVAADELLALKLAWANVEAAEARVQTEGRVSLVAGLVALVALGALAVWRERAAPPAKTRDDGEVQALLRERLEALYSARTQLGDGARFGAFGELAAALTHGLKTPLAGISASLQLSQLKLGTAHAAQAELDEALRLTEALTEQLQRFLRAAGQVGPAQQRVDVSVVLDAVRAATAPDASARHIQFSMRPGPPGLVIEIDTALVEMALRNLVENALAFGKRLELFAEVVAAPARVGLDGAAPTAKRYVALAVVDDGPGLPSSARRTEPGVTTRASGSGLGLAIARRVAERHQGALTLDDVEAGGTRVALVLPLVEGDR